MLRAQLRRFVERRDQAARRRNGRRTGFVPREVLRRMGALGFFGIRYPDAIWRRGNGHAGHGRPGRGARSIDLLRRRDHRAGPYRHGLGAPRSTPAAPAQKDRWMPDVVAGREDHRGRRHRAGRRLRREGHPHHRAARRRRLRAERRQDVHHQRRARRPLLRRRQEPIRRCGLRNAISMFLVEKGTPGFRVGRALDKQGWRSSDTAELVFEDCRVPAENLLGEEGRGFYAIMRNFQNERIVHRRDGDGRGAGRDRAHARLVTQRKAFGGRLWDKQAIRQRLAMLAARVEAGRQLVYHAAWLRRAGDRRDQGSLDGEGLLRRAGQRGDV